MCLFVAEINSELRLKDILAFWTGADRVPPCGFDNDLKIDFYSISDGERRLPSASNCSLTLNLPRNVGDPDILWLLLINAVKMSAGFGKNIMDRHFKARFPTPLKFGNFLLDFSTVKKC